MLTDIVFWLVFSIPLPACLSRTVTGESAGALVSLNEVQPARPPTDTLSLLPLHPNTTSSLFDVWGN